MFVRVYVVLRNLYGLRPIVFLIKESTQLEYLQMKKETDTVVSLLFIM